MIALEELKLFENDLRSSVPTEIGLLENLWDLQLYSNDLSGYEDFDACEVADCDMFFPADPIVLLLTTCFLSRTIPTFIGNLRLLEILQLGTYFFVKLLQENISFAVCSSY